MNKNLAEYTHEEIGKMLARYDRIDAEVQERRGVPLADVNPVLAKQRQALLGELQRRRLQGHATAVI